jgi:hypothetical protein
MDTTPRVDHHGGSPVGSPHEGGQASLQLIRLNPSATDIHPTPELQAQLAVSALGDASATHRPAWVFGGFVFERNAAACFTTASTGREGRRFPAATSQVLCSRGGGNALFERWPDELHILVGPYLPGHDQTNLALTNSRMLRTTGLDAHVTLALEAIATRAEHVDDISRIVTNMESDLRICDLDAADHFDQERRAYSDNSPVARTRLFGDEKGRLLELLAARVPLLDQLEEDVMTLEEQRALARFILIEANHSLKPEWRGDLTPIETGPLFGSLRAAIEAGVPLPTALASFPHEHLDPDVMADLALASANVLVMTGSTWSAAAAVQGVPKDADLTRSNVRDTALATGTASIVRGLDSIDEARALADCLDLQAHRAEVEESWRILRPQPETDQVLSGSRPFDVCRHADDLDHEDLTQLECMRVWHRGPALFARGLATGPAIHALDIVHPLSCQLARRLHNGSAQDWIGFLKRSRGLFMS